MKASDYQGLKDEQPFWGRENEEADPEIFIKRHDSIYGIGWDAPLNVDEIQFIEYVKPVGWQPPDQSVIDLCREHREATELAILYGSGGGNING